MFTQTLLTRTLATTMFAALLFTSSPLFAQVKIGTNPTTINAANNLEVEASTAGNKVSIDKTIGKVTIADGSQGAAKVLTSDVNGVATWQTLRTTAVTSFAQTSPGIVINIPNGGASGGSFCPFPALGTSPPPACATDLNRNASFTTVNATNDVIFDFTGLYSVAGNNTQIQFFVLLYVDKTTPGVFELVDSYYITNTGVNCSGGYMNYKTTLKNLPARNYNVKAYELNWYNPGTPATIGIGNYAVTATCGQPDFANQKITVSVSQ